MFALQSTVEDASVRAKVPKGWTSQRYTSLGRDYKKAIDPDGCCWYWQGGKWILNVYSFESSNAYVETINGNRPYPISRNGVISINGRRVKPDRWDH